MNSNLLKLMAMARMKRNTSVVLAYSPFPIFHDFTLQFPISSSETYTVLNSRFRFLSCLRHKLVFLFMTCDNFPYKLSYDL